MTRYRARYVSHTGTVVTFQCLQCQRTFTQDFGKGPRPKRLGPDGVAMLAKYWSNTTVQGGCRRCELRPAR